MAADEAGAGQGAHAAPARLSILYRDRHLVAIDKPEGLLVHRSDIARHETRFAVQMLRDQIGRRVQPVHRLDRGTSGILLFAFDAATARLLATQFAHDEVRKTYLAVVRGWPPESGLVEHPLSLQADDYAAARAGLPPREACTRYRRRATIELPVAVDRYPGSRYALMVLEPLTGRHHQLRRHMKHIAHPIIGDATHGKGAHNRYFRDVLGCGRLLLACTEVSFRHPASGADTTIRCPVGGAFADLLRRFGWPAD